MLIIKHLHFTRAAYRRILPETECRVLLWQKARVVIYNTLSQNIIRYPYRFTWK